MTDLSGKKFNRLTVLSFSHKDKNNHYIWNCKCDCGNVISTDIQNLKKGGTKSCGCLRAENCREIGHLKTIPWNKGLSGVQPKSQETREKISKALTGTNHWNWQGGITNDPYSDDWTEMLRDSIRCRDNYICQVCGIHQDEMDGRFKKLDVHHIDYNKQNCNPKNLISLCKSCHAKTNINREYWLNYFLKN